LLGGYSDTEVGTNVSPLTVTSLPKCPDDQFLVYRNGAVACEAVTGTGASLPDCKSMGQLLTYTKIGELSSFGCTPKGSIMLSTSDQTTITDLLTQITKIGTQITSIGMGSRVAARTYRGVTPASYTGALGGAAAAAATCAQTYGAGASMCDAYSMYISIAAGKVDMTKDIAGAWVYQADWTNPFTMNNAELTAGLGDNCSGYTSGATTNGIAGTKFSLLTAAGDATNRVPKFYSNTLCTNQLPIACCQ